jgi:8-oxo-dGTP pyrophosphatase MutT (NUDIX family)
MTDAIRSAATVILARRSAEGPRVLMGQRGGTAAFMPSKFVFPGGAVDPEDAAGALPGLLDDRCQARLRQFCPTDAPSPDMLACAALRELVEETGLTMPDTGHTEPALRFVFRAITPPGRTRRFDARFFLVDADALATDPDDFAMASGELSHLHWIGLAPARALDLPFITEVVIAEVDALLRGHDQPGVPFFDNSTDTPAFRRIV